MSVYDGPSPRERVKEERNDKRDQKCRNSLHPHLLQTQLALDLLLFILKVKVFSKPNGRRGSGG